MVFSTMLSAMLAVASPTPSATPTAPPEIVHVTTTDRSDESMARAARTTYVVTSAQIAQRGNATVADAVEDVPGVALEHYGGFGAGTSVSIRGSSSSQVLVLIDGLPAAGQAIGSLDLEGLTTQGVKQIEIVEGGGSTLYGSSSIGGVINVITEKRAQYGALASVGSFGQSTYQIDTPYLSFGRTYAANNYALPDGSTRENADGALTSGSFHYAHAIGAVNASFFTDLSNELIGVPGAAGIYSPTSREGLLNQDVRLSLTFGHKRSFASLDLGASRLDLSETCDDLLDPNCANNYLTPPPTSYAAQFTEGRTSASLRNVVGDESYRLIYGVDVARGVGVTNDGSDPAVGDAFSQTAGYVQSQWFTHAGNTFYVGLRGERDNANGAASPSLGGIVHLTPDVEVKANASTAFRAPNLEELYYPNASNPNLVPEHTRNADATIVADNVLGGASLGWFSTTGSNLIAFNLTTFVPDNIQHAAINGLIFSTKTRPLNGYSVTLDVTNTYEANDLDTGVRIDDRGPVFKVRTGFLYTAPKTSSFDAVGISAVNEGARGVITPGVPLYDQPIAFTRVDAFVSYRVTPKLLLTVRGMNLGNERYGEFGTFNSGFAPTDLYPVPGRSFALELRTR